MKKLNFITLFFLLIGSVSVFAQSSADVKLNVRLHPIQTIVINPAQKEVNLDYITEADYSGGVTSEQKDHITIYSTGAFAVKVNTNTNLESAHEDVTENISASDIRITATQGSSPLNGATLNSLNLMNNPQSIISSSTGGVDKTFDIKYAGAGANSYVNKFFNVENPTVYTTTVLYTIEAQ